MTFLTGTQLTSELQALRRKRRWHCAVAFWGTGADELVRHCGHDNVKVICNLMSGGTNPSVIEALPRHQVRHHAHLHAKVYLGDEEAIVCSANASANGLGLEGREQGSWIEAGIATTDIVDVIVWFNALWEEADDITDEDLRYAKELWSARQRAKPTLASFADFDGRSELVPLLHWDGSCDWKPNQQAIARQLGAFNDDIHDRISRGVQVRHPDDRALLKSGTWFLRGTITTKGRVSLEWVNIGPIIEDAVQLEGEPGFEPVAIASETPPPEPFDIDDREFQAAFRDLIMAPRYAALRDVDSDGPWFGPRLGLMMQFWAELQKRYRGTT